MIIGIIGLGLIGGSIAKALKLAHPDAEIIVYDRDEKAAVKAIEDGVVNKCAADIDDTFSTCDYLFLCAPVTANDDNLKKIAGIIGDKTVLTDVGSVKGTIHKCIEEAGLSAFFVGGHPMAGSEKTGYENSKADMFENVYYMLTPTDQVSDEKVKSVKELITSIKAIPLVITPSEHDYATGAISHLPHVIAAALVNLVKSEDENSGVMKLIAAGGFRDITRIASSSPEMWKAICLTNGANIVSLLDKYIDTLEDIKKDIVSAEGDNIGNFFARSKDYRDSFEVTSDVPMTKVFECKVDIPDVTGAISEVASFLAGHEISIKNIGIIHNREYEEGVLRIEFYDERALDEAATLLTGKGYRVYR